MQNYRKTKLQPTNQKLLFSELFSRFCYSASCVSLSQFGSLRHGRIPESCVRLSKPSILAGSAIRDHEKGLVNLERCQGGPEKHVSLPKPSVHLKGFHLIKYKQLSCGMTASWLQGKEVFCAKRNLESKGSESLGFCWNSV